MTSSFGQVIGTERDEIPDISSTNYTRTDPNLDEANKRAIEKNIEDTQQFYSTMKELARIEAETPMKNLEQLAVFSSSIANYKLVSDEFEEARKLRQEGIDVYEAGLEDIFNKEQNEFNYDNAVFTNELFNEGTFESKELLAAELNIPTEYDGIEDYWQEVSPSMIDAGFTTLQDNGWWSMPTVSEALELYGDVQERMIATYLHLATESGIDITSPAFKKHFIKTVYPALKESQDTNMELFTRNRDANLTNKIENNLKKDIITAIVNRDKNLDKDEKSLLEKIRLLNPDVETPAQAIAYLFKVAGDDFSDTNGTISHEDLDWLQNGYLWTRKGDDKEVLFTDLGLNNSPQILQDLSEKIEGGLSDANAILEANLKLFEQTTLADTLEEYNVETFDELPDTIRVSLTQEFLQNNPNVDPENLPKVFSDGISQFISKGDTSILLGGDYYAEILANKADHQEFLRRLEATFIDTLIADSDGLTEINMKNLTVDQSLTYEALKRAYIEEFYTIKNATNNTNAQIHTEALNNVMERYAAKEFDYSEYFEYTTSATAALDYANMINNDTSLLSSSKVLNPVEELEVLKTLELFKKTGNISPFFHNAAEHIDDKDGYQLFIERADAMGLIDKESKNFIEDKNVLDLDQADRDYLNRVSTPNAALDIIYSNQDSAKIIFNAARQTRINADGEEVYLEDGYIEFEASNLFEGMFGESAEQFNADNRTFKNLVNSNFKRVGRYGFTQEELEEAFNYIPEGGTEPLLKEFHNSRFDENLQTQIALVLWKIRVNQDNAMRGSSIDGETFWRLSDIRESEAIILNEFFSGLKDVNAYANWNHLQVDAARLFVTDKETAQANAYNTDLITEEDISNFVTENKIEYSSYEFYDGTKEGYGNEILPENFTFKDLKPKDQRKLLQKLGLIFKEVDGIQTIVPNPLVEATETVGETLETSKTDISDLLNNNLSNILNFSTEETDDTNEIDTGDENE